jgi:hypothetical protein
MLMSGQRCCKVDHDVVVLKLGTVVVNDSIHMMIERDLRRKARSTNTAAAAENSEYRFRAPHPLLSSSSSSRQATLVMVSEDDDDTIVILEDDFMSSNNSITTHN